ncbi:MAG: hypothetical protein HC904_00015 [Blastochloris sp.]|nr:hypothetical protein [Blastochloris sp.]
MIYSLGRFAWFLIQQSSLHGDGIWAQCLTFALGFSTCAFAYLCLPRGNWFYVLGHETTHAMAVLLSGGRVSGFKVSSQGGHVVSDRNSVLIALSPYFVPFYPMVIGLGWALLLLFQPEWQHYNWAFLLIWGASWGFHLCHTITLLKTRQPDFESQGYFFSFILILVLNLLIIQSLLWLWLRPLPLSQTLQQLAHYCREDYFSLVQLVKSMASATFHP